MVEFHIVQCFLKNQAPIIWRALRGTFKFPNDITKTKSSHQDFKNPSHEEFLWSIYPIILLVDWDSVFQKILHCSTAQWSKGVTKPKMTSWHFWLLPYMKWLENNRICYFGCFFLPRRTLEIWWFRLTYQFSTNLCSKIRQIQ